MNQYSPSLFYKVLLILAAVSLNHGHKLGKEKLLKNKGVVWMSVLWLNLLLSKSTYQRLWFIDCNCDVSMSFGLQITSFRKYLECLAYLSLKGVCWSFFQYFACKLGGQKLRIRKFIQEF